MKVYVVILHYKDAKATKQCIDSLKKYEKEVQIIVVNNDIKALSSKDFPKTVVINNAKNFGFARGVNIGIKRALEEGAEVVMLLNNDTIIKKPFLKVLSTEMMKSPAVGIIGPAICFEKMGKTVFDIGGFVNMWTGRTHHEEVESTTEYMTRKVPYITGAAMLIKKEVFSAVGLFDKHFFLYYEDVDFCLRAREKGFDVEVVPSVSVYHLLSKTAGKVSPLAVYYQTKSAKIFGKKYMQSPVKQLLHMFFLILQTIHITLKHPKAGIAGWKAMLQ